MELQNQNKQNVLCKVPPHLGAKGNEADKAAKQAIDVPRMTKTRLSFTNYNLG